MRNLRARSRSPSSNTWSAVDRLSCEWSEKNNGSYEGHSRGTLLRGEEVGSGKPSKGESGREGGGMLFSSLSNSERAKSYWDEIHWWIRWSRRESWKRASRNFK